MPARRRTPSSPAPDPTPVAPPSTNGSGGNFSANGHSSASAPGYDPILMNQLKGFIANEMAMSRSELRNLLFDDRRDVEAECGHPHYGSLIDVWQLRMLYDRVPEGAKICELGPKWTWSVAPIVEEDADPEVETDFEGAVQEFIPSIGPEESLLKSDEGGAALWGPLRKFDIQARIGSYAVLLLGFDDGRPLHEPILPAADAPMSREERDALLSPAPLTFPSLFGGTLGAQIPGWGGGQGGLGGSMALTYEPSGRTGAGTFKAQARPLTANRFAPNYPSEMEVVEQWAREAVVLRNSFEEGRGGAIPTTEPGSKPKNLLWINSYSEELCQIVRWDWNMMSPRFGLPIMYRITLNDPRGGYSGIGLPFTTVFVHWSRVIHLFDEWENAASSKFAAPPAMRPCLNEVLNIRKIRGASGEGFWKGAMIKLMLESHPQLGGDVRVNERKLKDMMENLFNSQQQWAWFSGFHVNPIAPAVADPTPHIAVNVAAICAKLDIPKRIWEGSERGELSSTQDTGSWEGRVRSRQQFHATPKIIGPFFDRMIKLGLLPKPNQFWVKWPDIAKQSDSEKAVVGLQRTQALGAYIAGGVEQIVPLKPFFTKIMSLSPEDADAMIEQAEEQSEEDMMSMQPEPEQSPEPTVLNPGQSMHDPESGAMLGKSPHPPQAPAPHPMAGGGNNPFGGSAPQAGPPKPGASAGSAASAANKPASAEKKAVMGKAAKDPMDAKEPKA